MAESSSSQRLHNRQRNVGNNTRGNFVLRSGSIQIILLIICILFAVWLWRYTSTSREDIKKHELEIDLTDSEDRTSSWSGVIWIIGFVLVIVAIVVLVGIFFVTTVVYMLQVVVVYVVAVVMFAIISIPISILTGKTPQFRPPEPLPPSPRERIIMDIGGGIVWLLDRLVKAVGAVVAVFPGVRAIRREIIGSGEARQMHSAVQGPQGGQSYFRLGLKERVTGNYFDCKKSTVVWSVGDLVEVGSSTVVTIKLSCANGNPYCLRASDKFDCSVTKSTGRATLICVVEPAELVGVSEVKVTYTALAVGKYSIQLTINDLNIADSPFERTYLPGPADCSKTVVLSNSNTLVARKNVYNAVSVEAKDALGNSTDLNLEKLDMIVTENGPGGCMLETELVRSQQDEEYQLLFKLEQDGIYFGKVTYNGKMVGSEGFTIICLDEVTVNQVEKQVHRRELNNWFEARLVPDGATSGKGKKVYCYITSRQLQVREYFLKFIPKRRVYTCRVCPSTKIQFLEGDAFCIDDGYQEPITLVSEERGVIGATFSKYMLKNIGGSENFQSKRNFFYKEAALLGAGSHSRRPIKINVSRSELFQTGYKALKGFSTSDWKSKLDVTFLGEYGLDWGGVRREFFTLLCAEMFETSGLFIRFSDSHQALVHPNPNRPLSMKLKYYEFCGKVIGKCLYESAMGDVLLVKARFTRSFLAQIIGLRVNYRYFETDDPELYTTKITFIKESDVSDVDLVFAEEDFSASNAQPKSVPLKPGGAAIPVTNENKMEYLNCLAQYRLFFRVKEEIESFLKGLNDIIPDNLLSIFDENELELLMCGVSTIDVADWKSNSSVNGRDAHFLTMISWFWTAVTNYSQEERTRLLQFVTGSSQLPSEGFSELNPKFTISHAPVPGRLPLAHTCFNEICISDHSTYESFGSSLRIAISEGSEGFGLA